MSKSLKIRKYFSTFFKKKFPFSYDGLDYSQVIKIDIKTVVAKGMVCGDQLCFWWKEWFMSKYDD